MSATAPAAVTAKPTRSPKNFGVTLTQLMTAGFIVAGFKLFTRFKDQDFTATITKDCKVRYNGVDFNSLSLASRQIQRDGGAANPSVNGWDFLQYKDEDGNYHFIKDLRQQFIDGQKPAKPKVAAKAPAKPKAKTPSKPKAKAKAAGAGSDNATEVTVATLPETVAETEPVVETLAAPELELDAETQEQEVEVNEAE